MLDVVKKFDAVDPTRVGGSMRVLIHLGDSHGSFPERFEARFAKCRGIDHGDRRRVRS